MTTVCQLINSHPQETFIHIVSGIGHILLNTEDVKVDGFLHSNAI